VVPHELVVYLDKLLNVNILVLAFVCRVDFIDELADGLLFLLSSAFLGPDLGLHLLYLVLPLFDIQVQIFLCLELLLEHLLQIKELLLQVFDLLLLGLKRGLHFLSSMGEYLLGFLQVFNLKLILVELSLLLLEFVLDFFLFHLQLLNLFVFLAHFLFSVVFL